MKKLITLFTFISLNAYSLPFGEDWVDVYFQDVGSSDVIRCVKSNQTGLVNEVKGIASNLGVGSCSSQTKDPDKFCNCIDSRSKESELADDYLEYESLELTLSQIYFFNKDENKQKLDRVLSTMFFSGKKCYERTLRELGTKGRAADYLEGLIKDRYESSKDVQEFTRANVGQLINEHGLEKLRKSPALYSGGEAIFNFDGIQEQITTASVTSYEDLNTVMFKHNDFEAVCENNIAVLKALVEMSVVKQDENDWALSVVDEDDKNRRHEKLLRLQESFNSVRNLDQQSYSDSALDLFFCKKLEEARYREIQNQLTAEVLGNNLIKVESLAQQYIKHYDEFVKENVKLEELNEINNVYKKEYNSINEQLATLQPGTPTYNKLTDQKKIVEEKLRLNRNSIRTKEQYITYNKKRYSSLKLEMDMLANNDKAVVDNIITKVRSQIKSEEIMASRSGSGGARFIANPKNSRQRLRDDRIKAYNAIVEEVRTISSSGGQPVEFAARSSSAVSSSLTSDLKGTFDSITKSVDDKSSSFLAPSFDSTNNSIISKPIVPILPAASESEVKYDAETEALLSELRNLQNQISNQESANNSSEGRGTKSLEQLELDLLAKETERKIQESMKALEGIKQEISDLKAEKEVAANSVIPEVVTPKAPAINTTSASSPVRALSSTKESAPTNETYSQDVGPSAVAGPAAPARSVASVGPSSISRSGAGPISTSEGLAFSRGSDSIIFENMSASEIGQVSKASVISLGNDFYSLSEVEQKRRYEEILKGKSVAFVELPDGKIVKIKAAEKANSTERKIANLEKQKSVVSSEVSKTRALYEKLKGLMDKSSVSQK